MKRGLPAERTVQLVLKRIKVPQLSNTVDEYERPKTSIDTLSVEIMETIFGFLPAEDVKSCRLANKKWKTAGDYVLRGKTRVQFVFPKEKSERQLVRSRLSQFSKLISEKTEPDKTPFYSFLFGGENLMFLCGILPKFWKVVRDMQFHPTTTFKFPPEGNMIRFFDVNTLVSHHLRILNLDLGPLEETVDKSRIRFVVNVDRIPLIKELDLENSYVYVKQNQTQIPLSKIKLGLHTKLLRAEPELKEKAVVLSQVFNLKETKWITLRSSEIILDFADCANAAIQRKELFLEKVRVQNWEKCDWKVKSVKLVHVNFCENNSMAFENIEISFGKIDMAVIKNRKKIKTFWLSNGAEVSNIENLSLPNLIDLKLTGNSVRYLPLFAQNRKLITLRLSNFMMSKNNVVDLKMADLPKNLERLSLQGIVIGGNNGDIKPLKKLVLQNFQFFEEYETLQFQFSPDFLVIFHPNTFCNINIPKIIGFLDLDYPVKTLMIGPFSWEGQFGVDDHGFFEIVDREASYYRFEGRKGLGIDSNDFIAEVSSCY